MKTFLSVIVVLGLLSLPLLAQDSPKAEIFGGYQYMRLTNIDNSGINFNGNGWDASLTGYFNKMFGVTGDFGGTYNTISGVSVKVYTYTGGPVVALNHEGTVSPFVHALFGGSHVSASASGFGGGSNNGFTMMYGGGVDVKMSKILAFRGGVDWVYFHVSGVSLSNNVRLATGIVLRF